MATEITAVRPLRPASPTAVTGLSIGEYLIRRLQDYGIGHVFGIPGDYVLGFYSMLDRSPIEVVTTTREDCAGFAADAYARVHGMGAVCVTYCVGGLSLCNSVAGAYAEKSPVVVITGSPGLQERHNNPLLHHRVRDFRTQYDVFEKLCIAGTELTDPQTAFYEIDRVLHAAARYKRPVYIEIPRDMVAVVPEMPHRFQDPHLASEPEVLAEAVAEAERWLTKCQRPVIVGGVELHRFALQDELLALAEGSRDSDHHHDARQERDFRNAPAVRRPVRRGDGQRRDHSVCRGERLRAAVGHVHDRHQPGHLHGQPRSGQVHLCHQRAAAHSASSLSQRAVARLYSRAGGPASAAAAARHSARAEPGHGKVRAAARRSDTHLAADRPAERIAQRRDDRDRRHRRRAVLGQRAGDSWPHGVHQSGLLHVDGLLRSRRRWARRWPGPICAPWSSPATGRFR